MFSREDFEFYKGFTGGHVEKHQCSYFEGEINVSKWGTNSTLEMRLVQMNSAAFR